MGFIVRVRGVEVICESLEDVERLVDRYAGESDVGGPSAVSGEKPSGSRTTTAPRLAPADHTLLREMISNAQGVTSEQIGHILGTSGKGVPAALARWGVRVGVSQSDDGEVFDRARPQGARGWKLKAGALSVARHILERS